MFCSIFTRGYTQANIQIQEFPIILTNIKTVNSPLTDPDKMLLVGEWSERGMPWLIKITDVYDTGKLEVGLYNTYSPTPIQVELANWFKLGNLLSIYIEIKDPDYPGSYFKLNYVPERDVLVGTAYNALQNAVYSLEMIRER